MEKVNFTIEDLDEQFESRVGTLIFDAGFSENLAKQWAMRELVNDHGSEAWQAFVKFKKKEKSLK